MPLKVHIESRKSNKVKARVEIIYGDSLEREEIIIGNVGLYFKQQLFQSHMDQGPFYLFVLLEKLDKKNDKILYSCNLSSEKLKITNQRFICDDSQWRVLFHFNHCTFDGVVDVVEFDLSVEMNTIEINNPLAVLYDDTELIDFELCAVNGTVQFHSVALATASPVLRQMLTGAWTETESRKLELQHTTQQTLQHLKEYLYLNILPNNNNDIELLLLLASYYLMTDLEKKCKDKLLLNIGHKAPLN